MYIKKNIFKKLKSPEQSELYRKTRNAREINTCLCIYNIYIQPQTNREKKIRGKKQIVTLVIWKEIIVTTVGRKSSFKLQKKGIKI